MEIKGHPDRRKKGSGRRSRHNQSGNRKRLDQEKKNGRRYGYGSIPSAEPVGEGTEEKSESDEAFSRGGEGEVQDREEPGFLWDAKRSLLLTDGPKEEKKNGRGRLELGKYREKKVKVRRAKTSRQSGRGGVLLDLGTRAHECLGRKQCKEDDRRRTQQKVHSSDSGENKRKNQKKREVNKACRVKLLFRPGVDRSRNYITKPIGGIIKGKEILRRGEQRDRARGIKGWHRRH